MNNKSQTRSFVYITPGGAVELADNKGGQFKQYWKQIAKYGDYVDPHGSEQPMSINRALADKLVENFKSGVRGYIPTPLGHPKTDSELADMNKGELLDVEARDDGLYGLLEIRDTETAEKIENKTIPDVSIAFDSDYQDKKAGNWVGATLKHVGLVVNPYLKGMTPFESALSDLAGGVLFSDGQANSTDNNNQYKENVMAKVTNDKDFPVEVKYQLDGSETTATIEPSASLEVPDEQLDAVNKQVADAVKPTSNEDDEELSEADKKAKELSDREAAVANAERELASKTAEASFATLLSEGKVVPAQKEAYIALSSQSSNTVELSEGVKKSVSTLLSEFLGKIPKGFKLSEENGVSGGDGDEDVELTDEEKSLTDMGVSEEDLKETKKSEGVK